MSGVRQERKVKPSSGNSITRQRNVLKSTLKKGKKLYNTSLAGKKNTGYYASQENGIPGVSNTTPTTV